MVLTLFTKINTMLMKTVQLPGTATNYSRMAMHTTVSNTNISLERVFKKNQTQHVHMD